MTDAGVMDAMEEACATCGHTRLEHLAQNAVCCHYDAFEGGIVEACECEAFVSDGYADPNVYRAGLEPQPILTINPLVEAQPPYWVQEGVFGGQARDFLRAQAKDGGEVGVPDAWALDLAEVMADANDNNWGIDVRGMFQPPTLITYVPGVEVPSYDMHVDYRPGGERPDRSKIAVTVLIQKPEEGGQLKVAGSKVDLDEGDACVIPGYVPHRILPVIKGRRIALVGWLGGPEWR